MAKPHHLLIALVLIAAIFFAACSPMPAFTPSPTIKLTTPSSTGAAMITITENPALTIEPSQIEGEIEIDQGNSINPETNHMNIQIGDTIISATLVENSSATALKEILINGPISINMRDYGSMEKVGPLGIDLPRNDQQITTEAGDLILYQGNMFVIYYAPNSWNFTRIGKIDNVTPEGLRELLGDGNVTITLSLPN